jgi:L-gulonate 3-dehydrogenase
VQLGTEERSLAPADLDRCVTVVGGGSIGVAWAIVFARRGWEVAVFEPDLDRRRLVPIELERRLSALARAGLADEATATIAGRVAVHDNLADALKPAFYVQECAPEDLSVKRMLFEELDKVAPPGCILASSSSALRISQICEGLACAGRSLIAHPGNPPYLIPIVELVPAPFTLPATVDGAEAILRSVGMSTVRLRREVEGFVFNRLQGAVLREAYALVRDGVAAPEDIDRVMRDGPGRRWSFLGPFEVAELNTRGGIEAHARQLGPAYARMGAERGQSSPWDDDLVATVAKAVQERFPRGSWEENVAWRDEALMTLEACRRAHPALSGPPTVTPPTVIPQPVSPPPVGPRLAASSELASDEEL